MGLDKAIISKISLWLHVAAAGLLLAGCSGSSGGAAIDAALGLIKSDGPVLTALPGFTVQQTKTLNVDVNNVKDGAPGVDEGMSYVCTWDQVVDGAVTSTSTCSTLPGTLAAFNAGTGKLDWTPSTSELGDYEIKISGTNKGGVDNRIFSVGVRLNFDGLASISNVLGDRMDLTWTANPAGAGYQIMKKNPDGTFSLFQTITDPNTSTVSLTSLTPLTTYTWRVHALDVLGNNDGNTVALTAVTTDLIRLEVSSLATQLSPGQSTTVTAILKDSGGNILPTTGLAMTFFNDGSGTGDGTFSATTDLGTGMYTATFTATQPGTLTKISASIPQYHFVQVKPNMTVSPLQIEILSTGNTLNPTQSVNLTARIRDFAGNLMATSGHGLTFSYAGGTSTGTFGPVIDNGNGTYSGTFTASTAGTAVTFGASISTTSTIYATAAVTVQPWDIEIASSLADVSVTRTSVITGRIKDWQGNYLGTGGKGMTISVSGVPGIANIGATTDVGDGTYTATLTGGALGSVVVTASIAQSHTVTVTAAVNIRRLRVEFVTSAANLMPGGVASLTGRVKDWQGNIVGVGGHAMTMSSAGGTSTGTISAITDNNNGTYSATFTAGSAGTAISISGTINESYQVDLSPSITVNRWRVEVASTASSIATGQTLTLTAVIKDYTGTQSSTGGQSVFFSFSGGTSAGSLGSVTDNNNGTYTAVFTGITPGTAITATASLSQSYQVDQTASITVEAIKLAVSVSQNSLNPGGTLTVTAQVQDQAGTNLTSGSYTIGFSYSGGTSTGSFSAVSAMGLGVYQATFTGASAGTAVSVTANASVSYTVVTPLPAVTVVPWKIELTAGATDIPIGQTTTITGRIKNWQDAYLTSGGDNLAMSLVTAGRGSISAITDNGDGTYTGTFTATGVGSTDVTASLAQSYTVTVFPTLTVSAIHLALTSSQAQMNPGDTVTVTAQVKNSSGTNLTTGSYTIGFSISGGSTTGSFGSTTYVGAGLYQATFTASTAGTAVTLAANANVTYVIDATQPTLTVVPWKIELTAVATDVPIGQTTLITGRIKDWQNNFLTAGGKNLAMSLVTAGRGSLSSVTDVGDGTYTSTFTASGVGTTLVTASISESYTVTVAPTLSISPIYLTVAAVQTSLNPGDSVVVTAQIKDSNGNNLVTGAYTIGFSHSGGTSTGNFGSTTSLGLGLYQATFTGSSAGTAVTVAANANVSYVVNTPQPALTVVPWKIELAAGMTAISVGQGTVITGRIKDWQNNYLTSGGKNMTMSLVTPGIGSISSVTDNGDGTYAANFTASGVGSTLVAAGMSESNTVTVAPTMVVSSVHIALSAVQTSLNPGDSVTVLAQLKDSLGNNLTTGSYAIGFSYSGGTSTGTFGSTLSLGLGLYSVQFTGLVAGTATTVSANANMTFTVDNTLDLTVVPWKIEITTSKSGFVIYESGTLTARIKDWQNNFLTAGGKSLNMSLVTAGVGLVGGTNDNSDGTYTATFTASAPGSTTVSGNISQSYNVTVTPTLTVEKVFIDVTVGSPEVSSENVLSGSLIPVTARLKNSLGALVSATGYVVGFSVSGGTSTVNQSIVTEVSPGIYRANFQGVLAGTALTISAATGITHQLDSTATLTVLPGAVISAANSNLTTTGSSVRSGETVTLTATLKDAAGNVMPGLTGVTFTNTGGSSTGTYGATTGVGNGVYTSIFTGVTPGTATTVKATYAGVDVATTVTEVVTAGAPSKLTVAGPASVLSNTCSTAFQLSFFDTNNNTTTLATAKTFTFTGSGNAKFYSDSLCTTEIPTLEVSGGLSTSSIFYMKSYEPASLNITFTTAGITQDPGPHAMTVVATANWIGSAGVLDSISSSPISNYYFATGKYDGSFISPWGMTRATISTVEYLFVTDSVEHTITKIRLSDGVIIGKLGRVAGTVGSIPTGGGTCTTLTLNAANVNKGWCLGGIYQTGAMEGAFNTPSGIAYLGGYLYVSDTSNQRIVKIDADTGEWVGWSGRITAAPVGGTCSGQTGTSSTWCLGGGGTTAASVQTGLSPNGNVAWGTTATGINGGNEFRNPTFIGTDGTNIIVSDTTNNRLVKLDPTNGRLLGWMGWVYDNTGIVCTSGNTPGNHTLQVATEFTDSWCTGGRSTHLAAAQIAGGNVNWPKIGIGWQQLRAVDFYDNGVNHFMYISDSAVGRIMRYTQADGYYRGWTGRSYNVAGGASLPAAPAPIAALMTGTCGAAAQSLTMGWCYGGGGVNTNHTHGLNGPFGIRSYEVSTVGYMVIANTSAVNVSKLNLATGVFQGYIGRVSAQPTGGTSGCSITASGSVTPGWCTGGTTTNGFGSGSFSRLNSGGGGVDGMVGIETDGTTLFTTDNVNFRIHKHDLATGVTQGALGLRLSLLPTRWQKTYAGVPSLGALPTSIVVSRDALFSAPFSVSYDASYMYVADTNNHRIKRYNALDGAFEGWAGVMAGNSPTDGAVGGDACIGAVVGGMTPFWCKGGGSTTSAAAGFNTPRDMVSDGTFLYVADNSNHRLVKLQASNGLFLGWIGGVAVGGTPSDSLYDEPGCTTTANPNTTPHFCLGGASINSNKPNGFNAPRALDGYVDVNDGNSPNHYYVIVADSGNNRIQKIDVTSGQSLGYVGRVNTAGTGNCSVAGRMSAGWCTDGVVNSANTTSPSSSVNNGYITTPSGIWVDTDVSPPVVYVADNGNGKVQKFDADTGAFLGWIGTISGITAHGCATVPTVTSATPGWCTGGTMTTVGVTAAINGLMVAPHGVGGDANYIYVTDSSTHRVLRFNKVSGTFAGWKGRVLTAPTDGGGFVNPAACLSLPIGSITPDWCYNGTAQPGYELDSNTPSKAAGLDTPRGIRVKGEYLIIVDSNNHRILQIPK